MQHSRDSSQQPFSLSPLDLEREHRITRAEMMIDCLSGRADKSDHRHDTQDVWNKGFTVALIGLASGLGHAKAGELASFLAELLRGLRP